MKYTIAILFFIFNISLTFCQSTGINNPTPNSNAALDVMASGNQGMLIPRITDAQRLAIVSPPTGLICYSTTNNLIWYYNGSEWVSLTFATANPATLDGYTYPTVTIGSQVWMAENLRTTKYSDGTTIPLVTNTSLPTTPAMFWYNNDQATYTANKYGALYNWYAVSPTTNGGKNVCPTGWHVPTDAEWTTLTDFLGGEAVAGGKMKTTGTTQWVSPNEGATNSSGFSGVPGGTRSDDGTFDYIGCFGYWWSSSENSPDYAWNRILYYGYSYVNQAQRQQGRWFFCPLPQGLII